MDAIKGEAQVIVTADMFGVPWRIMTDVRNMERKRITDLKSTSAIYDRSRITRDTIFDRLNGTYDSKAYRGQFFDKWRYFLQAAIYLQVNAIATKTDRADWEFLLAVASKQKPVDFDPSLPEWRAVDLALFNMNDEMALAHELALIEKYIDPIMEWKTGAKPAPQCGECGFCVAHRKVKIQNAISCVWSV
jgi:hypothetical protein